MIRFSPIHAVLALLLFFVELGIGFFLEGNIIRTLGGDFLVVMLIYLFVRAFLNVSIPTAALMVFVFSWTIEILQYFKLVEILNLQGNRVAEIIIGTRFDPLDLVAYTLGIAVICFLDAQIISKDKQST